MRKSHRKKSKPVTLYSTNAFSWSMCQCGHVSNSFGDGHVCAPATVTTWLSFATEDTYLGAIFVDTDDFESAHRYVSMMFLNPGGECKGITIPHELVPEEHRAAFLALPRLKLLTKDDLRTMGPLVNCDGEPR